MSTTPQTTSTPASSLRRGDVLLEGGRRWVVRDVGLAYRFARGRHEQSRTVLKVTMATGPALEPRSGRTLSARVATVTYEHDEPVRCFR